MTTPATSGVEPGPSANGRRVVRGVPDDLSSLIGRAGDDHVAWKSRLATLVSSSGGVEERSGEDAVARSESILFDITRRLAESYGTPDLGNKDDPVDELVYIILSRRTREGAYQGAYNALKERFASWEAVAAAPAEEIERTIAFSGLGRRKASSLKAALGALIDHFGTCTLEPLQDWTDEQVRDFLCMLPEIGPKSAACVMVCSLDRPAFPVDAHVGRVLERLGVLRDVGVELAGTDHKYKQSAAWDVVPPALRYPLHVNMLVHGRTVCLSHRPRCGTCVLRDLCASASR